MRYQRAYILFAGLFLLEAVLSVYLQRTVIRFEDIAYHINGAARLLAGEQLYRDIIVPNLPMFFHMRLPGAWIADLLHVRDIIVAVVFDNLMALLSVVFTLFILRRSSLCHPLSLGFIGIILSAIFLLLPYFDNAMGQQEYFFFLCTLPYVVHMAARSEAAGLPRVFRLIIGVFAAIGISYKPVFILPLLLGEIALCRYVGLRSLQCMESIVCVLFLAMYATWTCLLPGFSETYLPALRFYYAWHLSWDKIASDFAHRLLPFLIPAFALWAYAAWRKNLPRWLTIYVLALIGYALAAMLQLKTFPYHFYPPMAMALFLLAAVAATYRPGDIKRPAISLIACLLLAIASAYSTSLVKSGIAVSKARQQERTVFLRFIGQLQYSHGFAPLSGIYVLGLNLSPAFPELVFFRPRRFTWETHFYDQWLLEGMSYYGKRYEDDMKPKELQKRLLPMSSYLRKTVTADIKRMNPSIIIFPAGRAKHRQYMEFFSSHKPFVQLMRNYRLEKNYKGRAIYVRRE